VKRKLGECRAKTSLEKNSHLQKVKRGVPGDGKGPIKRARTEEILTPGKKKKNRPLGRTLNKTSPQSAPGRGGGEEKESKPGSTKKKEGKKIGLQKIKKAKS